ncbi:MAG TPA: NUDIX hydrolase [Acidobacteriota bacterium]|nr:NUDIX hydrolase [Acidobacteriota bacterium]
MPQCPKCGAEINRFRNPVPTVDIIIEVETAEGGKGIVLIERVNPPHGWAIPGGFIDYGETAEEAALREAAEETGLEVTLTGLLGVYSDPDRDPRHHTISTVFTAMAQGTPTAMDDAADAQVFRQKELPANIAFDHRRILQDYFQTRVAEERG